MQSPEDLGAIGQAVPGIVYLFDLVRGANVWANRHVADILGYSTQEVREMGDHFLRHLAHPDDLQLINEYHVRFAGLADGAALDCEYRLRSASGEYRWLRSRDVVYRRTADGRPWLLIGVALDVTDSKAREERLRLQADLLQAVQQAVIATDLKGTVTFWNRAAEALYGYSEGEAIGQSILDLTVPPAAASAAGALLRQLLADNVWRGAFEVRNRAGRTFRARVTNSVLREPAGRPLGFIGISEDISAEEAAVRALEQSEKRLALFARAANDALWDWDPATGVVWRNDGFRNLVGGPDPPGSDFEWWESRIHPDDHADVRAQVAEGLASASSFSMQYRLRRAAGDYVLVLDRAYIDRDAKGGVRRVVGAVTDITPLTRAEEALHQQEEYFRRIFEESPTGIALIDTDGRVTRVNSRFAEMLGALPADLVGASFLDFTHPEDAAIDLELSKRLFEGAIPRYRLDKRYLRSDGSVVWVSLTATVLRNREGGVICGLGMVEDITGRRAVEEALHIAREKAEAASEAKSAFLAQVSHEIRTPMNGLLGMLELLRSSGLSEEQSRWLEAATQAGNGLLRVINDILDVTKLQHGRLAIHPAPFSPHQLLNDLASLYRPRAEAKGIRFVLTEGPGVPAALLGDEGRLRQVMMNLLDNALRFTSSGSVELAMQIDPEGPFAIEFSVADTGMGIPTAALPSLFEPFSPLSAQTSRSLGGTGLGLAIAKQLIVRMGGAIGVESVPGAGSRFVVRVPLPETEAAPAGAGTASPKPDAVQTKQPFLGRTILLAEDNQINQRVGQSLLARLGAQVDVAASGVDALRLWQERPYDLILMDCLMPVMDGFEAAREIRRRGERGAEVPIVALTALALDEDRQECLRAGMNDVIAKPVRQETLRQVLSRFL
ncbi:MAG TPA: hypothetical protein DEH78_11215 [Solibacterales bacterium]|nr:hypothetical protein [Bryobacterales bacterium]